MSHVIHAVAPAKVNLSLRVDGKRADGYHELTSLVAFSDVGDRLELEPCAEFALTVTGPTAARIDGPNLIETAAKRLKSISPSIEPGRVRLKKILPVAAGVGGGSSDVAAYLRAVRCANPDLAPEIDWAAIALTLGADVPVCLHGQSTWMQGIGEQLVPLTSPLPVLHAVLVNPGIVVPTGRVFQALNAASICDAMSRTEEVVVSLGDLQHLRNNLEAPALHVAPEIAHVRTALETSEGVRLVRMSGSGATYFGIFNTADAATTAAETLSANHPTWWVTATRLGNAPDDGTYVAPQL